MAQIAYVDGHYLPLSQAGVNVEDRGYQFSDGVYEVFALRQGQLVDEDAHLNRLEKSLYELSIPQPISTLRLSWSYARRCAKTIWLMSALLGWCICKLHAGLRRVIIFIQIICSQYW